MYAIFARLMGMKTVSPQRLHERMQQERLTVIDVNSPQRWSAAHVHGAVNLDPVKFVDGDLPADKDATLVFYCSNVMCTKAPKAASRAAAMGYRDVHVMSAGIKGWVRAELPTDTSEADVHPESE